MCWHPPDLSILPTGTWGHGNWLNDANAPVAWCAMSDDVSFLWSKHLMFSSSIHETVED